MRNPLVAMMLTILLLIALMPVGGNTARAEGYVNESGIGAEGDTPHRVHWTLYRDGVLHLRQNDKYAYLEEGDDLWAGEILFRTNDNEEPTHVPAGKELVASLVVEEGIRWIPDRLFANYYFLHTVQLPDLEEIGDDAFSYCEGLDIVTVNGSVRTIGSKAFQNCPNLNEINIYGSVGRIGEQAFYDCSCLCTFHVNGTVGSIGAAAFKILNDDPYMPNLSSFNVPVTGDIGEYAFFGQIGLKSVSPIRGSLGEYAFSKTSLSQLMIVSGHSGTLGQEFFHDFSHIKVLYTGCREEFETRYVNNSGCTSIRFQQLSSGVRWQLEDGELSIKREYEQFEATVDLLNLTEQPWLNIPGRSWDENREQIAKVVVDDSVILGTHMLDELEDRLERCSGTVGSLNWEIVNHTLRISGSGEMPSLYDQDDFAWMPYRQTILEIVLGEGVTTVGFGAFRECPSLLSVSLPDSLARIDGGAFYGCSKLENVSLPKNLKILGRNAFTGCEKLKRIFIPRSVESVGSQAFLRTGLKDIFYGGTMEAWNRLDVGDVRGAAVHPSSDGLPPSAGGIYEGPTPGDQGNTGFWIALLFLSGTALLLLACFHRKKA